MMMIDDLLTDLQICNLFFCLNFFLRFFVVDIFA